MTLTTHLNFASPHSHTLAPVSAQDTAEQRTGKWAAEALAWRKQLGAPKDFCPWSSLPVEYRGLNATARVREILDLVVLAKLGVGQCRSLLMQPPHHAANELSRHLRDVYVDISQNPARRPYTTDRTSHCLTTASRIYSFGRQGLVLPLELLYWQGHSRGVRLPSDMSQVRLRDMAGEGSVCLC